MTQLKRLHFCGAALVTVALATTTWAQQPLTLNNGAPVGDNKNSQTAGEHGPVLLQDIHLIEKLAAFDRERIPERVVHARGAGAYGEFVSYGDYSALTRAAFLSEKGRKTPVFVRFSTVIHPSGSPETLRDPRGFAVKFYTEEGNYDIVGNNLPVFFIRDAIQFPDMVHSLKPSPITNRQDPNRFFEFFAHTPESTHMLTFLFSDYGIPANYREMNGFGVHAFKWVNARGEVRYVKYTWKSLQGVRNLTAEEARRIQADEFSHATIDLYENIRKGNFPSWELRVQILDPKDVDRFDFNPLDATKIWPENLVPSMAIGRMTLNRVPDNFFEASEQSAFSPGNLVPGVEPSEDRLLQGRLFSYFDTQRYRLGANFQQLEVNRPVVRVNNFNQDGALSARRMASDTNFHASDAVAPYRTRPGYTATPVPLSGTTQQRTIQKRQDFAQAGELYRSFSEQERASLIANLAGDLKQVRNRAVQVRMVSHFYKADADYGTRLAQALGLPLDEVKAAAAQPE
jgi:catalase